MKRFIFFIVTLFFFIRPGISSITKTHTESLTTIKVEYIEHKQTLEFSNEDYLEVYKNHLNQFKTEVLSSIGESYRIHNLGLVFVVDSFNEKLRLAYPYLPPALRHYFPLEYIEGEVRSKAFQICLQGALIAFTAIMGFV